MQAELPPVMTISPSLISKLPLLALQTDVPVVGCFAGDLVFSHVKTAQRGHLKGFEIKLGSFDIPVLLSRQHMLKKMCQVVGGCCWDRAYAMAHLEMALNQSIPMIQGSVNASF